jgi:hypothetical protein
MKTIYGKVALALSALAAGGYALVFFFRSQIFAIVGIASHHKLISPAFAIHLCLWLGLISPYTSPSGSPWMVEIFRWAGPSTEFADILLRYDIDIDAAEPGRGTALMHATGNLSALGVAYLLEHGAKPDHEDDHGRTALFHISDKRNVSDSTFAVIYLLLSAGANPCHADHAGITPAQEYGIATPIGRILDEACRRKQAAPPQGDRLP